MAKCPEAFKFPLSSPNSAFEFGYRANYLAPFRFLGIWRMLANSSKRTPVVPSAFYVNYIVCQIVKLFPVQPTQTNMVPTEL
jgi:hypothetical protein